MSHIDMVGRTYNSLTVVSFSHVYSLGRERVWNCVCVCGKQTKAYGSALRRSKVLSCGCAKKKPRLPVGEAAFRSLFQSYAQGASTRGLDFRLSPEQFRKLTSSACTYCGLPPSTLKVRAYGNYTYNGVDRVNNSRGYTLDNCVPCCRTCNAAKSAMSLDEWVNWVFRLICHQVEGASK